LNYFLFLQNFFDDIQKNLWPVPNGLSCYVNKQHVNTDGVSDDEMHEPIRYIFYAFSIIHGQHLENTTNRYFTWHNVIEYFD